MKDPSAPRMRYKVIGSGKPKRISKGSWESMIVKGPRKLKVHGRAYRPIFRSRQMHEQQAKKVKHVQDLGTTSQKKHTQDSGSFGGKCPAGMTCHLKEVRMSWNH